MKAYRKYLLKIKKQRVHELLHKVIFIEMLIVELALFASNLGFILNTVR